MTIITAMQGAAATTATTATTAPPSMNANTPSTNQCQRPTINDTNATTINAPGMPPAKTLCKCQYTTIRQ